MRTARQQRRNMSPAEVRLWNRLRRSPCGIGFRRQHPIGPYSADFYCPAAKLVIEVDGAVHDFAGPAERDEHRNAYMRELGLEIVRISAAEVFREVDAVADAIVRMCADAGPSTTQLR
jgi:very-short-patch-repair endonuclease